MEEKKEGNKGENKLLPNNSILFREDNNFNNDSKEEIFNTVIFTKMVTDYKNLPKNQNDSIKGKLKNLMLCGSCKRNLRDLYFCPLCKGYACKKCFNRIIFYVKKDHTPCPLCKKMVRRSNLKIATFLRTIAEITENDEDDNKLIKFNPIEIIPKCDIHNKNRIWVYCIDCNRKMCPICYDNENKKHSQHRCINYERYLELNLFFGNSFKDTKNFVLNLENEIKELQKLYNDLDDQKNNLLEFSKDIYKKIEKYFTEEQVKINDIIINLSQRITNLNNFRKNIKKHVTNLIPIGYSEFENMDELKKIIKERIEKINFELIKVNEVKNVEKDYYKKDIKFVRLEQKLDINKKLILNGIKKNIQESDNYIFNIELLGDDVYFYLNINKVIDGKQNNNPYLVEIIITDSDKNSKAFYLEFNNDNEDNYITYINSVPKRELANYFQKGEINIKIDYLKLI